MKRLRNKLNYSNVAATIALVLALTGTAYAALSVNSVRSRHIAPNAVKGVDVSESTLGAVPAAEALDHPDFGRLTTSQIADAIGIGMVMGRITGLGNNTIPVFADPMGVSSATTIESSRLMGTYLSGYEAEELQVQLLSGTMPAGSSRTFTLRAGDNIASMNDTMLSCTMNAGANACSFEGKDALSQLQDMLSLKIETSGSPGAQTFLFGYAFSSTSGT